MYTHDTMGLSHTWRMLYIASCLAGRMQDVSILLLTDLSIVGRLKFPINVDYVHLPGIVLGDNQQYCARNLNVELKKVRAITLPDLELVDNGGIEAFGGEDERRPMGIALYKRPKDGEIFVIVSRKKGPSGRYLWQYRLQDEGSGTIRLTRVREFGEWSGEGEIEAVAVDDALGYVYYSDEQFGIRKYHADPDAANSNKELAVFGTEGFAEDREGISIYAINDGTGYIIVSDQQANEFRIYTREGAPDNPHNHKLVKIVNLATKSSDGSEITNSVLNNVFSAGLFVAMSDDKTFHFYAWPAIAGNDLIVAPNGVR